MGPGATLETPSSGVKGASLQESMVDRKYQQGQHRSTVGGDLQLPKTPANTSWLEQGYAQKSSGGEVLARFA